MNNKKENNNNNDDVTWSLSYTHYVRLPLVSSCISNDHEKEESMNNKKENNNNNNNNDDDDVTWCVYDLYHMHIMSDCL